MNLFPYSLLRIAGNPYDELEQIEVDDGLLEEYFSKQKSFQGLKKEIDRNLYDLIGSSNDKHKQNLLLNLKRDIYNDRNISEDNLKQVFKIIDDKLKKLIESYFKRYEKLEVFHQTSEEKFLNELEKCRKSFRKLIEGEVFKKGLLLSSQSLLRGLESYSSKDPDEFDRNDLKAEQGALKYITRLRTKTSPFSTFTNLSILKHQDSLEFLDLKNKEKSVSSHVRLNNYLFKYLTDLMFSNPGIYTHFLLRPNPTIHEENRVFVYLTNNDNIESFQRIEVNPLLELLVAELSKRKEGIQFDRVIEMLTVNINIEARKEDLQYYLNQLAKYGFLEFNLGVSGIDTEWDVKLRNKLKRLEEAGISLIGELRAKLKKLRELAQLYEQASVNERGKILTEAFGQFREIALKLHKDAGLPAEERLNPKEFRAFRKKQQIKSGKIDYDDDFRKDNNDNKDISFKHKSNTRFYFKPKNIFYEDTTLDITGVVNKPEITAFVEQLNTLLSLLDFSKGSRDEMDKMVHFFKENYEEKNKVDLFSFYEDYYREVKKFEAAQKRKRAQNSGKEDNKVEKDTNHQAEEVENIQNRKNFWENWMNSLEQVLEDGPQEKDAETICISEKQIKEINKSVSGSFDFNKQNSLGAFIQFFVDKKGDSTLKGVINFTTGGFGKMLSRFLHLFDDEIKEDLREWNTSLVDGDFLLENTDASYFNANLHPPLMPYEIWIPGGHNSLGEEQQIPITDLDVKLNEESNELELIFEPENKRVYIFDLGFQGKEGRSELFQMLSNFTLMDYLVYNPLTRSVNKWLGPDEEDDLGEEENRKRDDILVYPRIEYENTLILQRKNWNIPESLLPIKSGNESDWDYFLKVNEWRKQYAIPKEVFVYVTSRFPRRNLSKKKIQKLSRDDYKPQYINFNSPLLVSLFETLVRKVPVSMKIEEMLPTANQLFEIDGKRFVTEFVVQWYNYNQN